jgi:hypothetical protein
MTSVSPVGGEVDVARLRALAEGTSVGRPYKAGDTLDGYCGKAGGRVGKRVDPLNWNTPERLAVYCETRGCSCSMDVSKLPKRYEVTREEFARAASPDRILALIARLEAAESARDEALAVVERTATALSLEAAVLLRNPCETDDRHEGVTHRCAIRLALLRDSLRDDLAALTPSAPTEETQA